MIKTNTYSVVYQVVHPMLVRHEIAHSYNVLISVPVTHAWPQVRDVLLLQLKYRHKTEWQNGYRINIVAIDERHEKILH